MNTDELPIAVIGAGPIGVVTAAHVLARGGQPLVLERGDAIGANVREWSHVKLFSPWKWIIDPVAERLLTSAGHRLPDPEDVPRGAELLSEFIEPLARAIALDRYLLLRHEVVSISRRGAFGDAARAQSPLEIQSRTPSGSVTVRARAVIDASGTWLTPNPAGVNGRPATGEIEHAAFITYRLPDVLGRERARYAGRQVAVVGSGHSAANLLIDLAQMNEFAGRTTWVLRNRLDVRLYGRGDADALTGRAQLGKRIRALVEAGRVHIQDTFQVSAVRRVEDAVVLETAEGRRAGPFDRVIAATGFSPDHSITRALCLEHDQHLGAPVRLAPNIDPAAHPRGTDFLHGYAYLAHPEPNYFTVGMKSYGQAPSFDLLTGCEQVRSVVAYLAGDLEAADRIEAVYPIQNDATRSRTCSPAAPGAVPCAG